MGVSISFAREDVGAGQNDVRRNNLNPSARNDPPNCKVFRLEGFCKVISSQITRRYHLG